MQRIKYLIPLILITINLNANEATYQFARDNQKGIELYKKVEKSFYKDVDNIMNDKSLSAAKKQRNVKLLRDGFMQTSREIHLTYRQPFLDAVLEETNAKLPDGRGVNKTLGSDIYKRDKKGKVILNADGSPKINTKHRGMSGDMDLGGDPQSIKQLEKTMAKYDVKPTTKGVYNHLDFDSAEVTINNSGPHVDTVNNSVKPKMSLHQAQMYKASINPDGSISAEKNLKLNAFSKETYNYVAMSPNQAGASYVLTTDNTKKAIEGFKTPSSTLLKSKSEAIFQGMNKGTLKSISSGKVTDDQLMKIIAKNKLGMSVEAFKEKLTMVKEGHIPAGVGITDKGTMAKYQSACRDVTDKAASNASIVAKIEIEAVETKIKDLTTLAENTTDGAEKEAYKKQAKMWAEQNADSKLRIKSGVDANNAKLDAPTKTQRVLTNVGTGLRVAGFAKDGYEIYDTYSLYKKGKISKDKAVSVIGGKSAGIATDVVIDVMAGKAVQGVATTAMGTISAIAAPIAIGMATSYTVGKATEEGLALMAAYKNEKLLNNIADKQMKKTADRFIKEANAYLTQGIQDGDFNNFEFAQDLSWKLYDMYERTGDLGLLEASNKIGERSDNVVSFLETEHGVSIYALKDKLAKDEEKIKVEKIAQQKLKEEEPKKKVVFFSSGGDENTFRQDMQREQSSNTARDNQLANQSYAIESQKHVQQRKEFRQGMQELAGSLQEVQNAMIVAQAQQDYNDRVALDNRQEAQKRAFRESNQAKYDARMSKYNTVPQSGSTSRNKRVYQSVGTVSSKPTSKQVNKPKQAQPVKKESVCGYDVSSGSKWELQSLEKTSPGYKEIISKEKIYGKVKKKLNFLEKNCELAFETSFNGDLEETFEYKNGITIRSHRTLYNKGKFICGRYEEIIHYSNGDVKRLDKCLNEDKSKGHSHSYSQHMHIKGWDSSGKLTLRIQHDRTGKKIVYYKNGKSLLNK